MRHAEHWARQQRHSSDRGHCGWCHDSVPTRALLEGTGGAHQGHTLPETGSSHRPDGGAQTLATQLGLGETPASYPTVRLPRTGSSSGPWNLTGVRGSDPAATSQGGVEVKVQGPGEELRGALGASLPGVWQQAAARARPRAAAGTRAPTVLDRPPLDAARLQLLVGQEDPQAFEGDAGLWGSHDRAW